MTLLITGAEGFVGRNLAESFVRNNYPVLAPTRAELDLANAVAVERYFQRNTIDTVIHCATTLREVTTYPADTCENNLRMFFNLERQLTPSMKLLHLGSGSEYDRKFWHAKMPEDFFDKHIPDDSHSYSKYLISKYIEEIRGKNIVCLRIFGIYGKYEDYRYKFISNSIVKNLLGMPIVINQNVVYDYLCVNDFNRIADYFVNNATKHAVYNITPTESIDLLTIARHINDVSAKKSDIQVLNAGIGVEYSGDNTRFLSEAPDFAFTPYRDAIEELYRHYASRADELDVSSIRKDDYLEYAKKLKLDYFGKQMRNSVIESDLQFIVGADLPWERFRNKTVLITGAAGFLPAYMVETLLYLNETRHYNIKIYGLVRDRERARVRFSHYHDNSSLTFIVQDVCDKVSIREDIDFIVHAASQATPKTFLSNPVGTLSPNVIGTDQLLKLAAEKRVECFLFFSTSGVHGHVSPDSFPIKEDCVGSLDFKDIASCYLESKRMGENMCMAWLHQHGVPAIIVRPATTYGPGLKLDDGRSFADFISDIVNFKDIELYSDGKATRNFCYLADATVGFFTVMLKGNTGEAYHIATDHEISIRDLATLLVDKVFPERKLKVVMKHDPAKNYLRVNYPRTAVDIAKARALGWELHFPVEAGFKRTVESYGA